VTAHIDLESFERAFPYFAVAICPDETKNWYAAGQTREQAVGAARAGIGKFPKPNYLIVARFCYAKVQKDIALLYMPVQGTA
jgi:hypothetical protein